VDAPNAAAEPAAPAFATVTCIAAVEPVAMFCTVMLPAGSPHGQYAHGLSARISARATVCARLVSSAHTSVATAPLIWYRADVSACGHRSMNPRNGT
jgi:hypothetical protein